MNIVVKLILICQIKDDIIPQLIPFFWVFSVFIIVFIIISLVLIYFLINQVETIINNNDKININERLIFEW